MAQAKSSGTDGGRFQQSVGIRREEGWLEFSVFGSGTKGASVFALGAWSHNNEAGGAGLS